MPHLSDHIVICGANLLASHTANYLLRLGCRVTLVVPVGKRESLGFAKTLPLERIVEGDCRDADVLAEAGMMTATGVLLLHESDLLNVEAALRIRQYGESVRIVSRIFEQHLAKSLDEAIPNHHSLSDSLLAAPAFALAATRSNYAGYFYLEDVTLPHEPLQLWEVAEIDLGAGHPWIGAAPLQLELERGALVVTRTDPTESAAAERPSIPAQTFFPPHDHLSPLRAGERIVVLGRPDRTTGIQHTGPTRAGQVFARRKRFRRHPETSLPERKVRWHRLLLDRVMQISPLVKLVVATLMVLLLVGVTVFAIAGVRGPDPFFYTIVVLTGGYGDLSILQQEHTAVWVKLVASLLTMLGAALVGLVYGAVTERVLMRGLGTLLLERKIPREGHVIVCGLGNIGMRVVEELHRMGMPVVAIEKKQDNPFVDAVRRLGVPVIVSSASASGILERARVRTARCLVGATDDDLVNLDVALAARSLNDSIRVVLRVFDQAMVDPLQKTFCIDVTYSMWMLAAPAFAAAALVGRTFGAFLWKDRSVVVQELLVQESNPLMGRNLEQVCEDFDVRGLLRGRKLDGGVGVASVGPISAGDRVVLLGTADAIRRVADAARVDAV